jgi:hypothetical protein
MRAREGDESVAPFHGYSFKILTSQDSSGHEEGLEDYLHARKKVKRRGHKDEN